LNDLIGYIVQINTTSKHKHGHTFGVARLCPVLHVSTELVVILNEILIELLNFLQFILIKISYYSNESPHSIFESAVELNELLRLMYRHSVFLDSLVVILRFSMLNMFCKRYR